MKELGKVTGYKDGLYLVDLANGGQVMIPEAWAFAWTLPELIRQTVQVEREGDTITAVVWDYHPDQEKRGEL